MTRGAVVGMVDEKFEGRNAVRLIAKGIGTRCAPLGRVKMEHVYAGG